MAVNIDQNAINRLARSVQKTDSTTAWTPRTPAWSMQQVTVNAVDTGRNVAHVDLNGGGTAEGVSYGHMYSAADPPQPGDTAWAQYNGRMLVLMGRQIPPAAGVVIPDPLLPSPGLFPSPTLLPLD